MENLRLAWRYFGEALACSWHCIIARCL